ncbi:hypothetical protein MTO96_034545, partial [Rhipicephalus appendiculatus]
MARFPILFVITVHLVTLGTLEAYNGPHKLQRDVADALKIFELFPYGVAIMETEGDKKFECLTALRKDFDPEAKTATYIWSLDSGEGQKR